MWTTFAYIWGTQCECNFHWTNSVSVLEVLISAWDHPKSFAPSHRDIAGTSLGWSESTRSGLCRWPNYSEVGYFIFGETHVLAISTPFHRLSEGLELYEWSIYRLMKGIERYIEGQWGVELRYDSSVVLPQFLAPVYMWHNWDLHCHRFHTSINGIFSPSQLHQTDPIKSHQIPPFIKNHPEFCEFPTQQTWLPPIFCMVSPHVHPFSLVKPLTFAA